MSQRAEQPGAAADERWRVPAWRWLIAVLLGLVGCGPASPSGPPPRAAPVPPPLAAERAEAYRRVAQAYTTCALVRPASSRKLQRRLEYLAPLIMQGPRDPSAATLDFARFGAVWPADGGPPRVATEQLTVYFFPSQAMLNGRPHDQWNYVWFYPPPAGAKRLQWRGFRTTLDADGLPAVWEWAADDAPLRVLFVSAALAVAAEKAFGPPLPGRRYAVEPAVADQPQVVVPRLLADGPQPMGPYVYLDGQDLGLTTLLCRCSPGLVERWFVDVQYELQPLRHGEELGLGDQLPPQLGLAADPAWLHQALRLPPGWSRVQD